MKRLGIMKQSFFSYIRSLPDGRGKESVYDCRESIDLELNGPGTFKSNRSTSGAKEFTRAGKE